MRLTSNTAVLPQSGGAALIMSLTVLMIITMLTINSMSSTLLEERMAANTQGKAITFQATESAISATSTNQIALNTAVLAKINTISTTDKYTKGLGKNVTAQVAVTKKTECKQDLIEGFSYRFGDVCGLELDGESNISGTGARTSSIQGLAYIVPKSEQN